MFKRAAVVFTTMSCLTLGIVFTAGITAASGASSTLTLENNTGVTFTNNFNPVDSNSFATQMSVRSLIYEPLFEFDSLKAGVSYPWLATKYAWSNAGKTLTFTIRSGVKWSDGSAFTPADVAATFNLVNTNPRPRWNRSVPVGQLQLHTRELQGQPDLLGWQARSE